MHGREPRSGDEVPAGVGVPGRDRAEVVRDERRQRSFERRHDAFVERARLQHGRASFEEHLVQHVEQRGRRDVAGAEHQGDAPVPPWGCGRRVRLRLDRRPAAREEQRVPESWRGQGRELADFVGERLLSQCRKFTAGESAVQLLGEREEARDRQRPRCQFLHRGARYAFRSLRRDARFDEGVEFGCESAPARRCEVGEVRVAAPRPSVAAAKEALHVVRSGGSDRHPRQQTAR